MGSKFCIEIVTKIPFLFQSEELIYKGRVNPLNSEERPELASCNGLVFPDGVARQFTKERKLGGNSIENMLA